MVDSGTKTADLWYDWARSPGGARVPVGRLGPPPEVERGTFATCWNTDGTEVPAPASGTCPSGVPRSPVLACEGEVVDPTWRRTRLPGEEWSGWDRLDQGACRPPLPVLTVEDFRTLPLPTPVLRLQPDRGWVLVNIATVVTTDDAPVLLRTALAGVGVDVEVAPVLFTYDFGDGERLVTRSPGRPYPHHDTSHEYRTAGTYAITLTTEWSARYRVDGDPTWRDVTGTATTSVTSGPLVAHEQTSRLVSTLCTDVPRPADC